MTFDIFGVHLSFPLASWFTAALTMLFSLLTSPQAHGIQIEFRRVVLVLYGFYFARAAFRSLAWAVTVRTEAAS